MAAKEVTFESKYTKHYVLRRPLMEKPLSTGGWVPEQQSVHYQFQPAPDRETGKMIGVLTVREGQDKLDTDHTGTLKAGKETGVMRDAAQFLMDHRAFGEDFWLLGFGPGTKLPRPQEWRADVRKASVSLDEETLVRMLNEEKASHARPDLIQEAEDALELVRGALAEIAAAKAAEAETEPKPAAKAKPKAPAA